MGKDEDGDGGERRIHSKLHTSSMDEVVERGARRELGITVGDVVGRQPLSNVDYVT